VTPAELSQRYPDLADDLPQTIRLFRWLINRLPLGIFFVSVMFIVIPRSLFTRVQPMEIVSWSTAHWSKTSSDYRTLSEVDPGLAAKFVVFNVAVAVICLINALVVPFLWYYLVRKAAPAPQGTNLPKNRIASFAVLIFSVAMTLIVPMPFTGNGHRYGFPRSEFSLIFVAIFWSALMTSVAITSVRELKSFFQIIGRKST
jgi:hypothetical protein